ncbi:hypothetical protein GS597_09230 [Synechococcales cyanobacterium C]|uniref:Uncharacterized protein n=1 Tax=Petrachloros mirabilis ULC683 TaxID=2781853 RepID=A0A8K2A826_9CYAN|nr:hypothetical protein [Petrachloros mirabilis]NCJ06685.1 hypothetical protein [Petrachloros mirabilis ULC683]
MTLVTRLVFQADGAGDVARDVGKINDSLDKAGKSSKDFEQANRGLPKIGNTVTQIAFAYNQATLALGSLVAIAKQGYSALLAQNEQLRQSLLATQASLVATNKVLAGGVEITDPTEAIQALEEPVNRAIDKIRKESLELVGLTSFEIKEVFRLVAAQSAEVGINLEQSADLALDFTAALGTLGVPLAQARQEVNSILQGTIDQNSQLARSLNITNDQVKRLKEQGKLYDFLRDKLEAFRAGNALAAQTIGGVSSNIQELFDQITLAAGEPLFEPFLAVLNDIFEFLDKNKDAITEFLQGAVERFVAFMAILREAGEVALKNLQPIIQDLANIFDEDFGRALENVVSGLGRFLILLSQLIDNPGVRGMLKTVDVLVTATAAITSLNGEFADATEAAQIYAQQSQAVANSVIPVLEKIRNAEEGADTARKLAIERIDNQIQSLKESNLVGAENRENIRAQITVLESWREKLSDTNGSIELVSDSTAQHTARIKEAAKAYQELVAQADIDALRTQVFIQEDLVEGIIAQKEATTQLSAATRRQRLEELARLEARARELRQFQRDATDQDAEEIGKQLLEVEKQVQQARLALANETLAERNRLEREALSDLEKAISTAQDRISEIEQDRAIEIQRLLNQRVIDQRQADDLRLGSTRNRIQNEIAQEEFRLEQITALQFEDEEERARLVRQAQLRLGRLTLDLLDNERRTQEGFAAERIRRIREAAEAERDRSQIALGGLKREQAELTDLVRLSEQRLRLEEARQGLINAQRNLLIVNGQVEIDRLNTALELRRRLNDEALDPNVRREIERQLRDIVGSGRTTEERIIRLRVAAEDQIAAMRRKQIEADQQAEIARNELALQRLRIEAQIADVRAQQGVVESAQQLFEAERRLAELREDPGATPQQLASAEVAIQLARENAELATRAANQAKEVLASQDELEQLSRETLAVQQEAQLAQLQAAEAAQRQANALAVVEARARGVADEMERAARASDRIGAKGRPLQARRQGGPVEPGQPYLVGEEGPEIVFPSGRGKVLTAQQTANLMANIQPLMGISTSPPPDQQQLLRRVDRLVEINQSLSGQILALASRSPLTQNIYNTKGQRERGNTLGGLI